MIEGWRAGPVSVELSRRVRETQVFLRMAAIELRRLAEQAPDTAVELRHVAQQLEVEAEDLSRRGSGENRQKDRGRSRLTRVREGQ